MHRRLLYSVLLVFLLAGCGSATGPAADPTSQPASILPPPTPPVASVENPDSLSLVPTPVIATDLPATAEEQPIVADAPTAEVNETQPLPQPTPVDNASAETARGRYTVGAAEGVPSEISLAAQQLALSQPDQFTWLETSDHPPDILLVINGGQPLATWVYAVAAPFATVADVTTFEAVASGWQSGQSELGTLLLSGTSTPTLQQLFGTPSPAPIAGSDLMGELWAIRPSWTIVPFHQLRPEFKALSIDGQSTLAHNFDAAIYPLTATIGVSGDDAATAAFLAGYSGPTTNRDGGRLTRVALSGVTALVRATAYQMEQNGILYPGEEVAPVFQTADIAHISNEVSFMPDCEFPDPYGGVVFCSADRYFELLQWLGIDVIELTGNHVNDFGREPLAHSLDLYAAAGMEWFGGGRDLADASRAAVFNHNGNQIAFIGCNPVGPPNAWAIADGAGARQCGPDMIAQISQLRDEGHVVFATLQYLEDYQYVVSPQQVADFGELALAGAAGVSGSQGHHAQGFSFSESSFIHYGLGNLFFDQMDMLGTRQSLVDTYVVYDGRVISVELWTGLIENWARPRVMTPEERADTLRTLFQASGW